LSPSGARDRLTAGIYLDDRPDDILGVLEDAMRKAAVAEPVRRRLHNARIFPAVRVDYATWVHSLVADKVIRPEEGEILNAAYLAADRAIQVDSFAGRSRTRKASPKI